LRFTALEWKENAQIVYRRQILQRLWNLHRVLPGESSEDFKKDECPGLFSAGKQGDGKVQEVRHVLASLPGLCYRRFRLIEFPSPLLSNDLKKISLDRAFLNDKKGIPFMRILASAASKYGFTQTR
jgi:hypothetical protein